MEKIKQSLRNLHKTLSAMFDSMVGREENVDSKKAIPTQRNQYYN